MFHECFDVLETVGQGAYSTVYSVRECSTGHTFAAKVIASGGEEEASIHQGLRHRCIVPLHSLQRTEKGETVLIISLVLGSDLFSFASQNRLCEAQIANHVFDVVDALDYLHDRGVVHGDVKLENVLVSHTSHETSLVDFGFSQQSVSGNFRSIQGSRHYMAPEILRACRSSGDMSEALPTRYRSYGVAVDMWAVGVMLYVLLVGEYPFADDKPMTRHKRILEGSFTIPSSVSASAEALDLLHRLLCPDQEHRITATQALDHPYLRRWRRNRSAQTREKQALRVSEAAAAVVLSACSCAADEQVSPKSAA